MKLKDIASEVGVSVSTVSRVLNGKSTSVANESTRLKIMDIAQRNNYIPNESARKLKMGDNSIRKKKIIACLFCRTSMKDTFFSQLLKFITQETYRYAWNIEYCFSTVDTSHSTILNILSKNSLDGLIILGRCNSLFLEQLYSITTNIVYIGLNKFDVTNQQSIYFDQVVCDVYQIGFCVMHHLYSLGHKKIAYIGETKDEKRFDAYCAFINKYNLHFSKNRVSSKVLSISGGYDGMKEIYKQSPDITAVFCANDNTAVGCIRACKELNLSIPKDISIVGVDNLEFTKYVSPSITTVHVPVSELASMSVNILNSRIHKYHSSPIEILFPFHIVKRESS